MQASAKGKLKKSEDEELRQTIACIDCASQVGADRILGVVRLIRGHLSNDKLTYKIPNKLKNPKTKIKYKRRNEKIEHWYLVKGIQLTTQS